MGVIDTKAFAKLCGDGWNAGDTKPETAGYYLRQFTDGEFRQYFDGGKWFSVRFETDEILYEHWRQLGSYPCWRSSI